MRGDLAPGQRADREVEQWTLTERRFPDGQQVAGCEGPLEPFGAGAVRRRCGRRDSSRQYPHDHRVVGGADEAAEDLELARPKRLEQRRVS